MQLSTVKIPCMDSIMVKNFRCFGEEQTVRLAPLTLLVGENSTGKTSFLALIRALSYVAYGDMLPNFRQEPYDLGSFDEIVHNPSRKRSVGNSFEAGFTQNLGRGDTQSENGGQEKSVRFRATFANRLGIPHPVRRQLDNGSDWIEYSHPTDDATGSIEIGVGDRVIATEIEENIHGFEQHLLPLSLATHLAVRHSHEDEHEEGIELEETLRRFLFDEFNHLRASGPPFGSAPIRSRPSRTYDPTDVARDPEGDYVPTFLARSSMAGGEKWEDLQGRIVDFGRKSGLFDDFRVDRLGDSEGSPFQVHVRKAGKRRKGPHRNLVDMGYGISQVLPILTEVLRDDGPETFLLQQPEVHLHPSAQAELGTLFCSVAATGKQLIIETHSDNLIDRVRMDVRDSATGLTSDDVSILYFERDNSSVKIHSLLISERGEVLHAPPGYRQFFMDEVNRSVGLSVPLTS